MPFKSEAQRKLFAAKVQSGEMSQATFDEWNKGVNSSLPERVGKKVPTKIGKLGKVKKIGRRK